MRWLGSSMTLSVKCRIARIIPSSIFYQTIYDKNTFRSFFYSTRPLPPLGGVLLGMHGTILMQIYADGEIVPPLKTCSLKIYERINFKSWKYSKNNGANGLSLNFFLKSTEFAAYGEMVPRHIHYMCIVTCVVLFVCRHIKDIKATPPYDNASKQKHVLRPALYMIQEHIFLVEGGYFHRGGGGNVNFITLAHP